MILDGQLADALAGHREDRISHRRGNANRSRLADAAWRFAVLHKVNLDLRSFVDTQDAIVVEIMLLDTAILQRDLAP